MLAVSAAAVLTLAACGSPTADPATTQPQPQTQVTNSAGSVTDLTNLPLGDSHVSTSTAAVGSIFVCGSGGAPGGGGTGKDGPWIHSNGTFDLTTKLTVAGSVAWPTANVSITESGGQRVITGNNLPVGHSTGTFPIAVSDPAHAYDANPNHIAAQTISKSITLTPTVAAAPGCVNGGPIGYATTGVPFFDGLDAENRDAVAHEIQDKCGGHPNQDSSYHYHSASTCIPGEKNHTPTLIGYALDGFGIYNGYDASGKQLTNNDLDACHGTTSAVTWNGSTQAIYHYVATAAYPYLIGCYKGGNVGASQRPGGGSAQRSAGACPPPPSGMPPGQPPGNGQNRPPPPPGCGPPPSQPGG